MRMSITAEQIESIPGATNVLLEKIVGKLKLSVEDATTAGFLSKIIGRMSFDAYDWSHSHIQAMLTNDIVVDGMELYSPVFQQATLDALVPGNWPGQPVNEFGVALGMTYGEYLRSIEVTGGFCLQFAGGPMDANRNITLPSFAQLKLQITAAGGFLTRAEVDAIRIIVEEL